MRQIFFARNIENLLVQLVAPTSYLNQYIPYSILCSIYDSNKLVAYLLWSPTKTTFMFGSLWCLTPLSTIFQRLFLLVSVTGVSGENNRPSASQWQTLSHSSVSSKPRYERGSNSQLLW